MKLLVLLIGAINLTCGLANAGEASRELLNLSGVPLPEARIPAEVRERLGDVRNLRDAGKLLSSPCVVATPFPADFEKDTPELRFTDSGPTTSAKVLRAERARIAARAKAERLAKALPQGNAVGLSANRQIQTTLRRILWLAASNESGVRSEAQEWIRGEPKLQAALAQVFSEARKLESFKRAAPGLDFLLGVRSERSEDALRALDQFIHQKMR